MALYLVRIKSHLIVIVALKYGPIVILGNGRMIDFAHMLKLNTILLRTSFCDIQFLNKEW